MSRRYFAFFLLSGVSGLVYETVWLRLAMANFGVTAPSLSIVLSVFMGGLALGAALVGHLGPRLERLGARQALQLYAAAELAIGLLGLAVPRGLALGRSVLERAAAGRGPVVAYAVTLGCVAVVLLPSCTAMGTTLPLGMLALRRQLGAGARRSFSYLYLANVAGAIAGTLATAFVLIELEGFQRTLLLAAGINALVAALAFAHARTVGAALVPAPEEPGVPGGDRGVLALLFLGGLCSMGMEVVWTREFTPFMGTVVYSFATILACYLAATFLGSSLYRRAAARGAGADFGPLVWAAIALVALLPLIAGDYRLGLPDASVGNPDGHLPGNPLRVLLAVGPFSAALGYITPALVDRHARGDAGRAGTAYAVNTLGCILGPLAAGFWLLPSLGDRLALAALAAPFLLAAVFPARPRAIAVALCAAAAAAVVVTQTRAYEARWPQAHVVRDHTATSIAVGSGMNKQLLVNGIGMTVLTPVTKMMAHLTLAFLEHPPERALVICFGMGTTFRSLRSWGVPTTAVELVPGVPALFGYYHPDGPALLASPDARVVIDDGRRFLETTPERYDAILIDPPPPVEAASSSLLYSREFYALARARLRPGGIVHQWFPGGETVVLGAVVRAMTETFSHVRVFQSFLGWGYHLVASDAALPATNPAALAAKLPPAAAADLVEWGPQRTPAGQFAEVLRRELYLPALYSETPGVTALEDDWPVNEYYLLRSALAARKSP